MMKIHFGKRLQLIAEKKGLKVEELQTLLDKSQKTIYDDRKKQHLSTKVLEEYAEVFGIELMEFFEPEIYQSMNSMGVVSEDSVEYLSKAKDSNNPIVQELIKIIHNQSEQITSLTNTINTLVEELAKIRENK